GGRVEVLCVEGRGRGGKAVEVVGGGGVVAGIEKDRAKHRLEGVGQQGLEPPATASGDPFAKEKIVTQAELLGQSRQSARVNHGRSQLGHLAFLRLWPKLEEILRGDELQNRVTEVFKALIVAR